MRVQTKVGLVHQDVARVQEAVLLHSDVDKGSLHAGQDVRGPAFIDVADQLLVALSLDVEFGQFAIFDDGQAGLVTRAFHQQFPIHPHFPFLKRL